MLDPCEPKLVDIIQGGDKDVTVRLIDSNDDPFDLTSATEIIVRLAKTDGTRFEKKLSTAGVTVTSALGGKLKASYSETDTPQLKVGKNLGLEVLVTIGSVTTVVQIPGAVNVLANLY